MHVTQMPFLFRVSNVSGNVFVNGKERSLEKLRKMSCYIMQRDELCPVLNVIELMQYAANLKLGNYKSKTEKEHLVSILVGPMLHPDNMLSKCIEYEIYQI